MPWPPPLPTASPTVLRTGPEEEPPHAAISAAIAIRNRSERMVRILWTSGARRGLDGRGGIRLTPGGDGQFPSGRSPGDARRHTTSARAVQSLIAARALPAPAA